MCILRGDPWREAVQKYVISFAWRDAQYPEGSLIRFPDSKSVFLIKDGKRRQFGSGKIFLNAGYDFDDVKTVDKIFELLFPDGPPFS